MKFDIQPDRGFSLIEVTLALGVMSFCMVAIFGLLPTGLNSNQAASQQSATINIMTSIQSDLRGTPTTQNTSTIFGVPMADNSAPFFFSETGTLLASEANALYRAQVFLKKPDQSPAEATPARTATTGRVVVSWPAGQSDITRATGSSETFVALNRN